MTVLAILGASGHGKVIADAALKSGCWQQVVFFDDAYPELQMVGHWAVVGTTEQLIDNALLYDGVIVAIGNNAIRFEKQLLLRQSGCHIATVIHPSAQIGCEVMLGYGTVVLAGAVVNPFARVGSACIINSNAVVEHDCVLGDGVHVSPGGLLAGGVNIGSFSWIGMGSCIRQLICIGENVVIGAGTVVVKDQLESGTVVGNPARYLVKSY